MKKKRPSAGRKCETFVTSARRCRSSRLYRGIQTRFFEIYLFELIASGNDERGLSRVTRFGKPQCVAQRHALAGKRGIKNLRPNAGASELHRTTEWVTATTRIEVAVVNVELEPTSRYKQKLIEIGRADRALHCANPTHESVNFFSRVPLAICPILGGENHVLQRRDLFRCNHLTLLSMYCFVLSCFAQAHTRASVHLNATILMRQEGEA